MEINQKVIMDTLMQFQELLIEEGIKPVACFQRNTKDEFEAIAPTGIKSSYWIEGLSQVKQGILDYKKEDIQEESLRKYLILRQTVTSILERKDLAISSPTDIELIIGDITSAEDPRQITRRLYKESLTRNDTIVDSLTGYNQRRRLFNIETANEAEIESIFFDITQLVHTLNIELEMSDTARIKTTLLITNIMLIQAGFYPIMPNLGICQYIKDNLTETRPLPCTQEAIEQCYDFADELLLALKNSCEIYFGEKMLISNIQNGGENKKAVKGFGGK